MFSPPSLTVESNLKVSAWNADKIPPLSLCTLREKIEREMIYIYIYIFNIYRIHYMSKGIYELFSSQRRIVTQYYTTRMCE